VELGLRFHYFHLLLAFPATFARTTGRDGAFAFSGVSLPSITGCVAYDIHAFRVPLLPSTTRLALNATCNNMANLLTSCNNAAFCSLLGFTAAQGAGYSCLYLRFTRLPIRGTAELGLR